MEGRRYVEGEHRAYDVGYEKFQRQSQIFHEENRATDPSWMWLQLNDLSSLQRALAVWQGDASGHYYKGELQIPVTAHLPYIRQKVTEQRQKVQATKKRFENEGDTPEEIKKYIAKDIEKLYELEAEQDICRGELSHIKKLIAETKTKKEIERSSRRVLVYGLLRQKDLRGGVVAEIDGQKVSKINGMLVIDDEASKYDGMALANYNELAESWMRKRRENERNKLKELQRQAKGKGEKPPKSLPGRGLKKVKQENLPPWPKEAVNHKKPMEKKK